MLPFQKQSYHGFESYSNQNGFLREPCLVNVMDSGAGRESILSSSSRSGKNSTDACKSHKEAERRRRQRINAHLSTLRTLLPSATKTDKASLLAEVVHHVRELRKQVSHLALQGRDGCCSGSGAQLEEYWPFPEESDEATLSYCDGEAKTMRVSVSCDDRPGLNRDLSQAIRLVKARAVRAEMMTVGGRTKSVVVVEWRSGGGGEEEVGLLRRALKAVVENRVSSSGILGQVVHGNKRVRGYGLVKGGDDVMV